MNRGQWSAVLVLLIVIGLVIDRPNETIRDRMIKAVEKVDSYTFTNDIVISTQGVSNGAPVNDVSSIKSWGATDILNKRMFMNIEISSKNQIEEMDVYFIGNDAYISTKNGVRKQEFPLDEAWGTKTQIKQQSGLFKQTEVEMLPDEVLDGRSVHVIKADPDIEKLIRYMAEQSFVLPELSEPEIASRINMAKSIEILQWVDKETFLPVKFRMGVVLDNGQVQRKTTIIMTMDDYNGHLDIMEPVLSAS